MTKVDFAVGIGGENGQGIASTGDILARIFARRGLHLNAYTAALGAALQLLGIQSEPLESSIARQFKKKGEAVVNENVGIARAGYDHAARNFKPFPFQAPKSSRPLAIVTGNQATAMGGVA